MGSFRKRLLSGSLWTLVASLVRYAFDLVFNIVLARILAPKDFGLVAMAMVVSNLVAIFGGFGLGTALVQKKQVDPDDLSSVFWVSLGINTLIGVTTALSAPVAAQFYGERDLLLILPAIAVQFPIHGLNTIPMVLLKRSLRHDSAARIELMSSGVAGVVAISLALNGFGYWSIVLRTLCTRTIATILFARTAGWRPGLAVHSERILGLLRFTLSYQGNQILVFCSRNLDTVLIGRFLGSTPLGIYNRAYSLMMMPVQSVAKALHGILFAAFSSIQDDKVRIGRIYLRFSGALATFIIPSMLGLLAVAEPAVLVVLGERWKPLIPVVQTLIPIGICEGVFGIHQTLFMSQGRTDLQLRLGLIGRLFVILGISTGIPYGIVGVARGFAVGSVFHFALNVSGATRLVNVRWRDLFSHLNGVMIAGVVMLCVLVAFDVGSPVGSFRPVARLCALTTIGACIYVGLVTTFKPKPYRDLLDVVASLRARRLTAETQSKIS